MIKFSFWSISYGTISIWGTQLSKEQLRMYSRGTLDTIPKENGGQGRDALSWNGKQAQDILGDFSMWRRDAAIVAMAGSAGDAGVRV